jgi:uncharacterized membrane protein
MPRVTYTAAVDHPPETVFAFVSDAENNPRWHEHVRETRWLDEGPTRLGRRGRQFGHLFGRDWAFVAEVVEWEPPRLVTFQVIEGYKVRTSIRTEPAAAGGGTDVTLVVTSPRILTDRVDRFVSSLMRRSQQARIRGDTERLRKALDEAAAGAEAAPVSGG